MDTIYPPVETPPLEEQLAEYQRARSLQDRVGVKNSAEFMPLWVPSAIRITGNILPGDWPCTTTLFGVIHVAGSDGRTIQINVSDSEILAFRWNAKRETWLREQDDLKSEISNLKSEPQQELTP